MLKGSCQRGRGHFSYTESSHSAFSTLIKSALKLTEKTPPAVQNSVGCRWAVIIRPQRHTQIIFTALRLHWKVHSAERRWGWWDSNCRRWRKNSTGEPLICCSVKLCEVWFMCLQLSTTVKLWADPHSHKLWHQYT